MLKLAEISNFFHWFIYFLQKVTEKFVDFRKKISSGIFLNSDSRLPPCQPSILIRWHKEQKYDIHSITNLISHLCIWPIIVLINYYINLPLTINHYLLLLYVFIGSWKKCAYFVFSNGAHFKGRPFYWQKELSINSKKDFQRGL